MKKLFVISFILSLGFASCLDNDNDPVYYFYDEPAIVELSNDQTLIRTAHGLFFVTKAESSRLQDGDLLWTSFTVDMGNQSNKDTLTAIYLKGDYVDKTKPTFPANKAEFEFHLNDSYSDAFDQAILYKSYLDSLLFFNFTHKKESNRNREYELVLNPETEDRNGFPTLYIRAMEAVDDRHYDKDKDKTIFAFDMAEFVNHYRTNISKTDPVTFNLKYKVGEDKEGKDVYREFRSNPIRWNIK